MKVLGHKAFLTAAMLLAVLVLLLATPRLGPVARFVPLIVLAPTIALLLLQLAADLARRVEPPAKARDGRAAGRLGWALLLPAMVFLFGFFVAVPLHAAIHLRWLSGERWRLSLGIPAALGMLLFLVARMIPTVTLWPGWIWTELL